MSLVGWHKNKRWMSFLKIRISKIFLKKQESNIMQQNSTMSVAIMKIRALELWNTISSLLRGGIIWHPKNCLVGTTAINLWVARIKLHYLTIPLLTCSNTLVRGDASHANIPKSSCALEPHTISFQSQFSWIAPFL